MSPQRDLRLRPHPAAASLERILASAPFARSERMKRFLRFALEELLAGRAGRLKEYLIGVEVFDRRDSYDPRVDPIVRVEARRLRAKLRQYYETDGLGETVRIEFPKGGYVPRLVRMDARPPEIREDVILVQPFTGSRPGDCLLEGLTEEVVHALTKVDGLRVAAGGQGRSKWILAGSVRREPDHLRIAAQLIDAAAGIYLWSEIIRWEPDDRFADQEKIARTIVAAVKAEVRSSLRLPLRLLRRPLGPLHRE